MLRKCCLTVMIAVSIAAPVGVGAAAAAPSAQVDSPFCETGRRFIDSLGGIADIEAGDDEAIENFWKRVRRAVKRLQQQAPPELEGAFRTIAPVYEKITDRPKQAARLFGKPKFQRALNKLSNYAIDQCGIQVPTG